MGIWGSPRKKVLDKLIRFELVLGDLREVLRKLVFAQDWMLSASRGSSIIGYHYKFNLEEGETRVKLKLCG